MPVLKIKKADGTWQEVWGCMSAGTGGGGVTPKLTSVIMLAENWVGDSNPWSQVVSVNGVNVNSKLDLQPNPTQIVALQDAEISLMLTNNQGIVTAWAIGNKPAEDYEISVLITEVDVV
jgi:hypothetical protein